MDRNSNNNPGASGFNDPEQPRARWVDGYGSKEIRLAKIHKLNSSPDQLVAKTSAAKAWNGVKGNSNTKKINMLAVDFNPMHFISIHFCCLKMCFLSSFCRFIFIINRSHDYIKVQ